jgi:hypothetical protein
MQELRCHFLKLYDNIYRVWLENDNLIRFMLLILSSVSIFI